LEVFIEQFMTHLSQKYEQFGFANALCHFLLLRVKAQSVASTQAGA
jgi:hypothetical protein